LLSSVSATKRAAVQAANPGAFTVRTGTLPPGWTSKEVFNGKVDANLAFLPGGSSVVTHMAEFTSFNLEWNPFAFHSDELCAHHKGTLTPDLSFHGSYSGDPHTRTVDGTSYDFQGVGEFTLLRDGGKMEVQARQTPVPSANPVTDGYSGLTSCVSVITAVAARLGSHRIALQPGQDGPQLQILHGRKAGRLAGGGINLGGHRVTMFDANGETGVRVDYDDQTVLLVTPAFWGSHNIWYINVSVSQTRADEGIMGFIPRNSWLPSCATARASARCHRPARPTRHALQDLRQFLARERHDELVRLRAGTSTKRHRPRLAGRQASVHAETGVPVSRSPGSQGNAGRRSGANLPGRHREGSPSELRLRCCNDRG